MDEMTDFELLSALNSGCSPIIAKHIGETGKPPLELGWTEVIKHDDVDASGFPDLRWYLPGKLVS